MEIGIVTMEYDTWINDAEPLDDDDVAWFKEEIGLSREDLFRIVAKAKEIVQGLKPNDALLNLDYDADVGNWYLNFCRSDKDGRWNITVYRKDRNVYRTLEERKEAL